MSNGDKGMTQLGTTRVPKCDCNIDTLGELDSLFAQIYRTRSLCGEQSIDLFSFLYGSLRNLGASLSKFKGGIKESDIAWLDKSIGTTPKIKLTGFMDFTKPLAIEWNECRVRTRTLERVMVKAECSDLNLQYINRLSSFFFIMSIVEERK